MNDIKRGKQDLVREVYGERDGALYEWSVQGVYDAVQDAVPLEYRAYRDDRVSIWCACNISSIIPFGEDDGTVSVELTLWLYGEAWKPFCKQHPVLLGWKDIRARLRQKRETR